MFPLQVISTLNLESAVLCAAFSPVDNNLLATVAASSAMMHRMDADTGALRSLQIAALVR